MIVCAAMRGKRGVLAAAILLLLLAVLGWRSVVDPDVGLHLAGGRWIAEHAAVPETDPFTWTVSDHPTVAYHWLFQLGLYGVERLAGIPGLAVLRLALLLATGLLLADLLRLRRVAVLPGTLVALAALLASEWRFALRPELASLLLASATLSIVERRREGRSAPLWLLPILFLLWVNLHVWVLGMALLGLHALDEAIRRRSLRTPLVGWTAAALLATLVNPYGLEAVTYPLVLATRLSGDNVFARHISELASPLALAPDGRNPFSLGLQLSAYRLLLILGCVAVLVHLRRRRWLDAAVVAVFGLLSTLAVRNLALYAVITLPALAVALDDLLGPPPPESAVWRRRLGDALLGLALGYALLLVPRVVSGSYYAEARRPDRFAAELCRDCLCVGTADWLAASGIEGRGLNNLTIGASLSWRDPGRLVFIDARNEVSGEAFYREYLRAMDPAHWRETQTAWALDYVVLAHRGDLRARALARALFDDPAWRLVYLDGAGLVFVRAAGPNGRLPEAPLPGPASPAERARGLAPVVDQSRALARARRWLWSRDPGPGARYGKGALLLAVDRPEAAEQPLLAAAAAHPAFYETHFDLGVAYRQLGRPELALRAFRNAHLLAPDHPDLAPLGEE
jgi:tetratricopeptide (TPR) repeat protein